MSRKKDNPAPPKETEFFLHVGVVPTNCLCGNCNNGQGSGESPSDEMEHPLPRQQPGRVPYRVEMEVHDDERQPCSGRHGPKDDPSTLDRTKDVII